jgi:hypothetical protein
LQLYFIFSKIINTAALQKKRRGKRWRGEGEGDIKRERKR